MNDFYRLLGPVALLLILAAYVGLLMATIPGVRRWRKERRLRTAQINHAKWKAQHEEWIRQLEDAPPSFRSNPYNRHQAIKAAGEHARWEEELENLMREPK